jgi:hypothetical protein
LASLTIWTISIGLIFFAHLSFVIGTQIIFHHHLIFRMGE